jgi:hypothetical protein
MLKIQAVYEPRLRSYVKKGAVRFYALTFRKDFNVDKKRRFSHD